MMTHRYATRTLLSVLLLSVVGCAPAPPSKLELASSTPSFEGTLVRIDSPEQGLLRVAQRTENPSWSFLALPFRLSEVPKAATLDIVATGVDSACPLTGQPQGSTTLSVNKHPVTQFTLGPEGKNRAYRIRAALDTTKLRLGDNVLEITGTKCSLGRFEVVLFNGIVLTTAP